jgi:hypothetical protein
MPKYPVDISVVVPIYNEVDNIEPLVEQLTEALESTERAATKSCASTTVATTAPTRRCAPPMRRTTGFG